MRGRKVLLLHHDKNTVIVNIEHILFIFVDDSVADFQEEFGLSFKEHL